MRNHGLGVAALLLAGAAASVAASTAALHLVSNAAISHDALLTNTDVHRQLAQATQQPPSGQPTPSPTPSQQPSHHSHSAWPTPPQAPVTGSSLTQGGTVYASCAAGQVTLKSWIPAQGYQAEDSLAGPGTSARVTFTSASGEITVTATCVSGKPHFATAVDDNHGGGAGGAGGGGGDEHGGRGGGRGGGGGGGGGHDG
jgi:hypothetical protein